ncbi:MAG TPA: hypothetical protein PK887_08795 [Ignavibacteriales bacterium]|nr:hypothetical protein [Ignavibacteriales bacterium]
MNNLLLFTQIFFYFLGSVLFIFLIISLNNTFKKLNQILDNVNNKLADFDKTLIEINKNLTQLNEILDNAQEFIDDVKQDYSHVVGYVKKINNILSILNFKTQNLQKIINNTQTTAIAKSTIASMKKISYFIIKKIIK